MPKRNDYSSAEENMFHGCEYGHMLVRVYDGDMDIMTIYRMCVEKAFCNNSQGPAYDALRRAYKAIRQCTHYRMTPEFDKLISF